MSGVEGFCLAASANAVGTMMTDYLVRPVERGLRYLFRFHKIVKELDYQKGILTTEQTEMDRKIEEARGQIRTLIINEDVGKWIKDAEDVLKDVQSLEGRIEENKRCFRWCPNWSWRLSKEIEKKTLDITKVVVLSKSIGEVGHRAPLPGIEFMPSEDFVVSKSSTAAFNGIMEALKNDKVNMIGVWGMGGVGKTTLVTEVGNKAKEMQLFHKVIKAVVSQPPDIEKIQQKIADILNFKFEKETKEGKAEELWCRLENIREKVLIILDDVWKELMLKEIGIPLSAGNDKGCKIILTTRNKHECSSMRCKVTVPLDVFKEEEAWDLFKKYSSLDNNAYDREIIEVAKEVAKECKGLPIALVPLAKALKDKDMNAWESALENLKISRLMDIENVEDEREKNAFTSLKISYDHLRTEPIKRCFLMCGLFPEDYLIEVEEELVRYAWGLMLYPNANTSIENMRREVLVAIDNLKDSSLVLQDEKAGYIKVHDVVRDVARWIARNENNGLLTELGFGSQNESSKQKLEILLLKNYGVDTHTTLATFEGMQQLKVLSLSMASKDVPFSFSALESLTNLRVLQVESCSKLKGISSLVKLTKLEILSLHDSEFIRSESLVEEFADEFGELKNLRVLDLCGCVFFLRFAPNFTRRLDHLEELFVYHLENLRISIDPIFLPELNSFSKLSSLSLAVSSLSIPKGFIFPKLQRYRIAINTGVKATSSRSLNVSKEIPLNAISKLLLNVESLEVHDVKDKWSFDTIRQNVPVAEVMRNLKDLRMSCCENLQVIFQMEKVKNDSPFVSKLEKLELEYLPALEYIWKLPIRCISLQSLKAVKISHCGKLKSGFSFSLAQSLVLLEKLEIENCGELEQVVEEGDDETSSCINLDTTPPCLPKLGALCIIDCDSLKYIFPKFMSPPKGLPQLKRLVMAHLPQLKQMFRPATANQSEEANSTVILPNLMELSLSHCPELTYSTIRLEAMEAYLEDIQLSELKEAFSISAKTLFLVRILDHNLILEGNGEGLNELTSLQLDSCDSLEYLVETTKEHVPDCAFTNLVELSLDHMHGLKMLCNGLPPNGFLQNLKKLIIENSWQLQEIFQMDEVLSNKDESQAQKLLSNLEHLELQWLPELRWILKGPPTYVNLQSLKVVCIRGCRELKYLFSPSLIQSLVLLEKLEVCLCDELETLFSEMESDGETESNSSSYSQPLHLPNLRTLEIYGCRKLKYVLPINLVQGPSQLEKLKIENCYEMRTLFMEPESEDDETDQSSSHAYPLCGLPKLRTLKIYECGRLEYTLPITLAQGLPQLEKIKIKNCNEMITLFMELESDDETESSTHIYPLCLPKLRSLDIIGCETLEYVLPMTLAQVLPELESVQVSDCPQLEQVFGVAKEQDGIEYGIELPRLKDLILRGLTNLISFAPTNYLVKVLALEKLIVFETPQLTKFTIQQEVDNQVHLELKDVPFSIVKEFSFNIKEISLEDCMMDDQKNLNTSAGLKELTSLKLQDCEDLECLVDTTSEHVLTSGVFTNLVELVIKNVMGLKLFCYGQTPKGFLQNLEMLKVQDSKDIVSLSLMTGGKSKTLESSILCATARDIWS